ncbi:MAG: citrate synthase/methylcitrate synthase [Chloroflexota bacterium]
MQATNGYKPGLEGVVAAQTKLSRVNGQIGELVIGGYPIETLAPQATFEEVVYLLWNGRLPSTSDLSRFSKQLTKWRALPDETLNLLKAISANPTPPAPMDVLRMVAGTLDLGVAEDERAVALLARLPTVVAAYWRLKQGLAPVSPHPTLGHSANYLYMLFDKVVSDAQVRALETYLNTVIDHGLNASTFAARVIIATQSDIVSAVVGAIGALKGPLHGGAPGPALDMVFHIESPERAEAHMRHLLDGGERLMGFGHRVYKVRDPRAVILSAEAERLFRADGDMELYELAKHVEQTAVSLLAEYKPGRNLQTNVEFYTALLLHGLGLETALFTPTFAIGRAAGWIGHCYEQQQNGRLIRPKATYIGVTDKTWQPIEARAKSDIETIDETG